MNLRFLSEAIADVEQAASYYDEQSLGVGSAFINQVMTTVESIAANPAIGTPLGASTRRRLTVKFPYAVIYQVRSDFILVVAVMHLRRMPGFWQERVSTP